MSFFWLWRVFCKTPVCHMPQQAALHEHLKREKKGGRGGSLIWRSECHITLTWYTPYTHTTFAHKSWVEVMISKLEIMTSSHNFRSKKCVIGLCVRNISLLVNILTPVHAITWPSYLLPEKAGCKQEITKLLILFWCFKNNLCSL